MKRITKEELAKRLACAVGLADGTEGLGILIYGWFHFRRYGKKYRKADAYERSTPLSEREQLARSRFSAVAAAVKARKGNLQTISQDQAAFQAQKDLADGRKTFKAYLWQVCGDEYDAQH